MSNLFDLEKEINDLLAGFADTSELIEDDEALEVFTSAVTMKLAQLKQTESDKVDGYGMLINKLEAEETRLDGLVKSLSARKRSTSNRIKSVKDFFLFACKSAGKTKLEGEMFIARLRNNKSVNIVNMDEIPEKLKVIHEPVISPDKAEIKRIINAGQLVPGAEIKESQSVTFKAN